MRAVLPGKPQARLQTICIAQWEGQRLVVQIWTLSHKFGTDSYVV